MNLSNQRDPRIDAATPKSIEGLKVYITKYNGNVISIEHAVTEISLYESIYSPFVYGELIVIDNSAMLSTFPFIGQEKVRLEWTREDRRIIKDFYVTDVFDAKQLVEGVGSYGLSITSEKQIRNSFSLFSKAYRGRGDEIIKAVHDEFLKQPLTVMIPAKTSHSVVFPYMKPTQAMDMVRANVLASDGSPLFLFDSLYGDGAKLDSMRRMLESEPVFDLQPAKVANNAPLAEASRNDPQYRGQVYESLMTKGFDTLKQIVNGAYASTATMIDISTKEAATTEFSFVDHAPPIAKNWISEYFRFDQIPIHQQYDAKAYTVHQNKLSFCDDEGNEEFPNLTSMDERDKLILYSYMSRLNTVNLALHMNSLPDLEVGKTVTYTHPRFSPKLNPNEDADDKVNSGVYLISAIRHYIKNLEYSMSIELVRDGMGQEASLYPNGEPSLGTAPVFRRSILPPIEE